MKFLARLGSEEVVVRIDGVAMDNFISLRLVEMLDLPHRTDAVISTVILLGTGQLLSAKGKCEGLTLQLSSDLSTTADFFIYKLQGYYADIILGVDWLKTLGQVRFDWTQLTMRFELAGNEYCLKGVTNDQLTLAERQRPRRGAWDKLVKFIGIRPVCFFVRQ